MIIIYPKLRNYFGMRFKGLFQPLYLFQPPMDHYRGIGILTQTDFLYQILVPDSLVHDKHHFKLMGKLYPKKKRVITVMIS